jgi:hypothetical protein
MENEEYISSLLNKIHKHVSETCEFRLKYKEFYEKAGYSVNDDGSFEEEREFIDSLNSFN